MGPFALFALLTGALAMSMSSGSDEVESAPDLPEEPDTPDVPDEPDTPDTPDEPDTPDTADEPQEPRDTGASFATTDTGVQIEVGEDETGSLAVIYYTDTEDRSDPDDFLDTQEARFYLVPEGVDLNTTDWESQNEIPGVGDFEGNQFNYQLADFEAQLGLKLLGVVDIDTPVSDPTPQPDRVGDIVTNAPIEGYFLEANTDGDDLISFLPEDYVVTRNGVAEQEVSVDTQGTEGTDWLTADTQGITIDGGDGDDYLDANAAAVTLNGGAGDDEITSLSTGGVVDGGAGDDNILANDATVTGGADDDQIIINSGAASGGEGSDTVISYGVGASILNGNAGDDNVQVSGAGSQGYGDEGDDFIATSNGATGYGGAGNDRLQMQSGTTGFGGDGDDELSVLGFLDDADGTAVITTGDGADTINVTVRGAYGGEADEIFLRVTDFDLDEDMLEIENGGGNNPVAGFEIIEAPDASYTDVRVTYTGPNDLEDGIAVIRLEGTTGLTASNIVVTS